MRIARWRFEDASELSELLRGEVEPYTKPEVTYMLGPDGTQFSRLELHEETLTDGSIVHHIVLQP